MKLTYIDDIGDVVLFSKCVHLQAESASPSNKNSVTSVKKETYTSYSEQHTYRKVTVNGYTDQVLKGLEPK